MSGILKVRKQIGANFRSLRKRCGLSLKALSEKADLNPVYISEVERATKAVSVEALWKISKALRVPLSRLVRAV
jgi:transcriptional regulator with XRE-family HTH domain